MSFKSCASEIGEFLRLNNLRNLQIDVSALCLIAAPKTPELMRKESCACQLLRFTVFRNCVRY